MAGENEDPEEHEGQEYLDVGDCRADEGLEEPELLEHLEVEQQLLGGVHDQWEAEEGQSVLFPVLLVVWHLQRGVLDAKGEVERVREESHQVDPVHEAGEVRASLEPQLFDLEAHQQQGGEHAHRVASQDHRCHEDVHLDEEGDEEADGVANQHVLVHLPRVSVLEIDDVPDGFLLADVAFSFLDDVEGQVREVKAGHREFGLQSRVVAAAHDLSVLVDVLLDVLDLALEEQESQIQEQALNRVLPSVCQLLLLQILVDGITGSLTEFVIRMRIREAL